MRQALHETEAYRILNQRTDDRNRPGDLLQCHDGWRAVGKKNVGLERSKFLGILPNELAFAG
jgi:hypothetical protein